MARPTNAELEEKKEKATQELKFKLVIYKELLAKKSDLQKEMDEIRTDMEAIMVRGRIPKLEDRQSLLSITRKENKPSRRFAYDKLRKAEPVIYDNLVKREFITETQPQEEYKIEVRHLKPTKKDLDAWGQRAKNGTK